MNQDTQLITVIAGVVVPLLVGILSKARAPSGLKGIMNAALSAIGAVIAQVIPAHFEWKPFIISWALTFVVSVATYFGVYKPTGVAPAVNHSTGSFGLG